MERTPMSSPVVIVGAGPGGAAAAIALAQRGARDITLLDKDHFQWTASLVKYADARGADGVSWSVGHHQLDVAKF